MIRPPGKITRLAVMHLLATALILSLGYYWLGVGESGTATLLWSMFVALLLFGLTCWAYAVPLVFFRNGWDGEAVAAWRTALRNLLPLAVAAMAAVSVYWLLGLWADSGTKQPLRAVAFRIASWLTLTFRKPVRPSSVTLVFAVVLWFVRWAVLPVLLLPAASAIGTRGWSGLRATGARVSEWRHWIGVPVLLLCMLRIPLWLVQWAPRVPGFWAQVASFTLRATLAYLLLGASWLVLAFITSRGKPTLTHPSTVGSP